VIQDAVLVPAGGRDVHELERALGEVGSHPRQVNRARPSCKRLAKSRFSEVRPGNRRLARQRERSRKG
jgi:hypothetical protein